MSKLAQRLPVAPLCVLLIVLTHLLFVLSKWHAIPFADGLPVGQVDPDTWLRLTLVRDWLAGGDWYDHLVHHSNTPLAPLASPWTRPVDLVLAFFVHLQPPDVDLSLRLLRASLLLPVLWMGLMLAGMMRAVKRIAPFPAASVMLALLAITQPGLWNYFTLGNADHHAPLAMLFVWVMVGVFTPAPSRRLMVLTGILFALQLWISVETLILIGAVYAYYGLSWLLTGEREKIIALSRLSISVALASILALVIERPETQWLAPVYDSISIVYITALLFCAFTAWLLRLAPARDRGERLIITLLASTLLIIGIGATYPHLIAGPTYGVDPFIITTFLPQINEARPFYKVPLLTFLPAILVPLTAALAGLLPFIKPKRAFYPLPVSGMLAFFVIFTALLYCGQQRWSYYMLPISLIALAPILGALFTPEHPQVVIRWPARSLLGLSANQQMARRLPITIFLLCMPTVLLMANASNMLPASTGHAEEETRNACYKAARQLIRSGELAKVLPQKPQNILAPTDLGTELLFFTPYRIVASNYHREGPGIRYVWGADDVTDEKILRRYLQERHIDIILTCPKLDPQKGSLLQAYVTGKKLPNWLKSVPYTLPPSKTPTSEAPKVLPLLIKLSNT